MKIPSRYIALGFSLLLVMALMYYFRPIVAYVLVAWVLSMVGQPFMKFFQTHIKIGKYKAGPTLSAILTIITFFIIFGVLIWTFVPLILEQALNLAAVDYSAIAQALDEPIQQLNNRLREFGWEGIGSSPAEQVQKTLAGWFEPSQISNFFSSLLSIAGTLMITIFSIVFITFFFLKEQGLFTGFLTVLVPQEYETHVRNTIEDITQLLSRYFAGILLQMFVITIFVSTSLGILGVTNALLIGFFAALINVIPYLGPMIGAAFGAVITISSNLDLDFYSQMLPLIFKVIFVFGIVQMIDNFILQPYIFSSSVLAHPLEIFIVIMMGAQLNGIVGMILAIPFYTVIRVSARVFLSEFEIVKRLTGGMDEI